MVDKQTAVHKRQKIQASNKMMFMWVSGASVVVGFAVVISWFLWQQIDFKMKVVDRKEQTVDVLKANNEAVVNLREDIRVLQTNSALDSARTGADENPVQVVLDALPADDNSLALGASLQKNLLAGISGINLEGLSVDSAGSSRTGDNTIGFSLTVKSADPNKLKQLLDRFEKSIRVIDVDSIKVDRSTTGYTMTIAAHAYYEPEKIIMLEQESLEQ